MSALSISWSTDGETWAKVKSRYGGPWIGDLFWISDFGNVLRAHDRHGNWIGRIINGWTNKAGYQRVRIQRPSLDGDAGYKADRYVHHLVLEAFVGEPPKPLDVDGFPISYREGLPVIQACHGDGDPSNNRLSNLRWDTIESNYADQRAHGTNAEGERNGRSKLSDAQRLSIQRSQEHRSVLAKSYGVDESTIRRIRAGMAP